MKIKKSSKGELASMIGGLLVVFGILSLALEANFFLTFGLLIMGIIVTVYGIFASVKRNK